jgi:hypothetical protein
MTTPPVQHRHVFYIGGFDPKGVSSFFQKHKIQLQRYCSLAELLYNISARQQASPHSYTWTVKAEQQHVTTHTTFEYLAWDDVVRTHWARTPSAIVRQALRCLIDFSTSRAIKPLYDLAPATARTALVPYALVSGAAIATVLFSGLTYLALTWLFKISWLSWLGALATATAGAILGWRGLKEVPSMWFLRVVDFANTLARNDDPHINQRISAWCNRIIEVHSNSNADEIVVLGYSAGSSLSVPLMAELARHKEFASGLPDRLSLLTLGNCIPVAAALKSGKQVRADLATIGQSKLPWLDYTAPIDWGSFPLVNPITVFTPASDSAPDKRRFVSPQFHLLFDSEIYQKIRIDKYHVHQLYLECTQKIGKYDYFDMLYGQRTILQRINEFRN